MGGSLLKRKKTGIMGKTGMGTAETKSVMKVGGPDRVVISRVSPICYQILEVIEAQNLVKRVKNRTDNMKKL